MPILAIALTEPPEPAAWQLALVGAGMVVANLLALPSLLRVWTRIAPARDAPAAPWMWAHVAFAVGLFFAANALLILALELADADLDALSAVALLAMTAFWQALIVAMLATVARRGPRGLAAVGLGERPGGADLFGAVTAYLFAVPAIFGVGFVWMWMLGPSFEQQEIGKLLAELGPLELVVGALFATVVVPLFEEVIFRGFLQPFFVGRLGAVGGIVLTAALFGLSHGWSAFLPIFVLALVLGAAMHRTQNLVVPWIMHGLNNGAALSLLVLQRLSES